jgi:soluble lytic murein transglycosylase-like protein
MTMMMGMASSQDTAEGYTQPIRETIYVKCMEYESNPWMDADKANMWVDYIIQVSQQFLYDPFMLTAQIAVESGFKNYAVSSYGAIGAMQIMPVWDGIYSNMPGISNYVKKHGARRYSMRIPYNLIAGVSIMKHLISNNSGDFKLALVEYSHKKETYRKYKNKKIPVTHNYYVQRVYSNYYGMLY